MVGFAILAKHPRSPLCSIMHNQMPVQSADSKTPSNCTISSIRVGAFWFLKFFSYLN